jgi:hypothetical protein
MSIARATGRDPSLPDETGRNMIQDYEEALPGNPEPQISRCE